MLNLKIILIVIKDWIKLLYNGFFIKHLNLKSLKKQCYLPYIESDLYESIYGRSSLQNLFLYRLFEETFNIIPDQKSAFFTRNPRLEFGLINSRCRIKKKLLEFHTQLLDFGILDTFLIKNYTHVKKGFKYLDHLIFKSNWKSCL